MGCITCGDTDKKIIYREKLETQNAETIERYVHEYNGYKVLILDILENARNLPQDRYESLLRDYMDSYKRKEIGMLALAKNYFTEKQRSENLQIEIDFTVGEIHLIEKGSQGACQCSI